MGRLRLSTILIGINVGLVLLAVVGVALAASSLLQQLTDEQGLARVTQAAAIAYQEILGSGEDVAITAQLLAERPTLQRLVGELNRTELESFLAQFQRTSQLDGCAVLRGDQLLAASGVTIPPEIMRLSELEGASYQLARLPERGVIALISGATVSSDDSVRVLVLRDLDAAFARQLSSDIGLEVQIGREEQVRLPQALVTGAPVAAHLRESALYVAGHPLIGQAGQPLGSVEVALPTSGAQTQLAQLTRALLLLAVGVALLAALGSLAIGRWLVRPLAGLGAAAERIGRGDLTTPVPIVAGAEGGALATTLDEMRRQLLQLTADLQRQQAEAYAIVTGISEGIFAVDRERRIRYITPQAAALLGVDTDEAVGRFCGDVLNPLGPDGTRPCDTQCPIVHARFRSGARATEQLLLRSGARRVVVVTSAADVAGRQVQVLRDETEVEATRRLRDAVLANISHEFRTPLSAQLASIELLLDQLPDLSQDQIAQLIQAQQRGTLRLAQLIDNLLESVRIEAGHQSIRQQPVALDEVVEAAIELMRPLLLQRGQEVQTDLPYPLPLIDGDTPRLTQVFVNLLANASKFAPEHTPIQIGGSVELRQVAIWIEDHGPGLPALATRALFSRFVRAPAGEPDQGGVGLGLAIVQSIVERHGGRVQAQNTGSGTRMAVILPIGGAHEDPDRR
jgi:signal transduction histidine kinase/HAMP domain-containing protein